MSNKTIIAFGILDETFKNISHLNNEEAGAEYLKDYTINEAILGERYKKIANSHILYNTTAVKLYYQIEQLYCLGLYDSVIMVSRSTVEYLASEVFRENIDISNPQVKEFVLENTDFRKVVNNYLYPQKILVDEYKVIFNKIYDIGNRYIHPNTNSRVDSEKDAEECILMLRLIINNLKTIFKQFDFIDGKWVVKVK